MIEDDPEEYLEFVHTDEFVDSVEDLLTGAEVRDLENALLADPEVGQVIPGTGGVRKTRFALEGRGKSGGIRVLYVYAKHDEKIYFLLAYPKNVRDTLTQGEKNALKKWVQQL
jgi:hypothetical protein